MVGAGVVAVKVGARAEAKRAVEEMLVAAAREILVAVVTEAGMVAVAREAEEVEVATCEQRAEDRPRQHHPAN